MQANQTAPASQPPNPQLQLALPQMTSYMRIVGILSIIGGAFYCLGIITAAVGIPIIIMGIRLRESAEAFSRYGQTNAMADLYEATERQMRFFFIQYVFMIIGIIGAVLYIFGIIVVIILAASGAFD